MSGEIERYLGSKVPTLREALEDRFPQPSFLTEAGARDRRNEAKHVVAMRQIGRGIELQTAETYAVLTARLMKSDAEAQLLSEAKFRIERAKRESAIIAGEDPELKAKFALLDDDYFQARRSGVVFGLDRD
jgi:hypothetical protein